MSIRPAKRSREEQVARASRAVTSAAQEFHRVAGHPDEYNRCQNQTCYYTHPMLISTDQPQPWRKEA